MNNDANSIIVIAMSADDDICNEARSLASKLKLLYVDADNYSQTKPESHFALQVSAHENADYQISLKELTTNTSPLLIDFSKGSLAHRKKFGGGRKQALARAVGIKPGISPKILDVTAGLARDAFVLASLGCLVHMIERSSIIGTLIEDGIRRAGTDPEIANLVSERMSLSIGDAKILLQNKEMQDFDVIYMDPMYPHRNKSALVKKEMRIIRQITGDDPDAHELLLLSLKSAKKRTVVKRPKLAPAIEGTVPTTTISSKNTRYDIYISQ